MELKIICPVCGTVNPTGNKYCESCGEMIANVPPQQIPPQGGQPFGPPIQEGQSYAQL